jgi:hypothetical protein
VSFVVSFDDVFGITPEVRAIADAQARLMGYDWQAVRASATTDRARRIVDAVIDLLAATTESEAT